MHNELSKLLFFTDTHFSPLFPSRFIDFVRKVNRFKPDGVLLTGDISEGYPWFWLEKLSKHIECPIYFVLGNHDRYFSSFKETDQKVLDVCEKYKNLIWLEKQEEPIRLNEEVALIGVDGWYSCLGETKYLNYTFDRYLIKEVRELSDLNSRIEYFKNLSNLSAKLIKEKLNKALDQNYKTVYIATHMPPFKDIIRDEGTILEKFWTPYNVNNSLGNVIEEIMEGRNKRDVQITAGHCHQEQFLRISRNINCQVGRACNILSVEAQIIHL